MKSQIDINRERNLQIARNKTNTKFKNKRSKILQSKRFLKFMEKLIEAYEDGCYARSLPLFSSKLFAECAVEKFNSHDFSCGAIYNSYQRCIEFRLRKSD